MRLGSFKKSTGKERQRNKGRPLHAKKTSLLPRPAVFKPVKSEERNCPKRGRKSRRGLKKTTAKAMCRAAKLDGEVTVANSKKKGQKKGGREGGIKPTVRPAAGAVRQWDQRPLIMEREVKSGEQGGLWKRGWEREGGTGRERACGDRRFAASEKFKA